MAEGFVYFSKGLELSFHSHLILGVQVNLNQLRSICAYANALPNNFSGVDNVIQDRIVYVSESAAARPRPIELSVSLKVLTQDGALRDNNYISAREFLLKFFYQSLLDLAVFLELREGDKDDDSFLISGRHIYLASGNNVQWKEIVSDGCIVCLDVFQFTGHFVFKLAWGLALRLANFWEI